MKEVAAGSTATTSNSSNSGSACSVALSFHLAGAKRCTPDECEDEVRILNLTISVIKFKVERKELM